MMTALKRWLAAPVFKDDEDKTRRAELLNATLLIILLFTILLMVGILLGGRIPTSTTIIDIIIFATAILLRYLLFKGKIALVGIGSVVFGILFVTAAIASQGTIRTPSTALYLFVVLIAGILFGVKGILATTLASSLAVAAFIFLENAGMLPQPDYTVTITQWITYTFLFGLAGYLTYFAYQTTLVTLKRTQKEIEERKRAEEALRESEVRFRSLFEQTHDAVFILDLDGHHLAVNQRAADMLGYTVDELYKLSVNDISAELEQSQQVFARLMAGEPTPLYERMFRKKDGQLFPVEINLQLVRDQNGHPLHIQSVVRDISRRKRGQEAIRKANEQLSLRIAEVEQLQEELREQALHDPLTGLYNRRYLAEMLEKEIARAKREKTCVSIIVTDIDNFKEINDNYGHQAGDRFLVEIATLMKHFTRSSDLICRYGGEEFVLVFPGACLESALQRAEEIRQRCSELVVNFEGNELAVTMSFGLSIFPDHGNEAEEIIIKADKAMYRSKQKGRNQVTVWN